MHTSFRLKAFLVGGSIWALSCFGCQNYKFEELPTDSIPVKRLEMTVSVSAAADILFVIDNSGSMAGEQALLAKSFKIFTDLVGSYFGNNYRVAVVTTGVESSACPKCDGVLHTQSCIDAKNGENGRFWDQRGKNIGTDDRPDFLFDDPDPDCRVITANNLSCFYDPATEKGVAMVGAVGCGYERGLEPIRLALSDLAKEGSWNSGFLRENATLVVVVVSDEDDCGKVGDVTEGLQPEGAAICYYAAKGEDHDGNTVDPKGKIYALEPVANYYKFLTGLKSDPSLVKFAAIVGVKDEKDLSTTQIDFEFDERYNRHDAKEVCQTQNCTGSYCGARPGTRYIEMARLFGIGQNGFVRTICSDEEAFKNIMEDLATFVRCPERFLLSKPIVDPSLANILINGEKLPKSSCSVKGQLIICDPKQPNPCNQGSCVPTWTYNPPTADAPPEALGGTIQFAEHYNPCDIITEGTVHIEVVYVPL